MTLFCDRIRKCRGLPYLSPNGFRVEKDVKEEQERDRYQRVKVVELLAVLPSVMKNFNTVL